MHYIHLDYSDDWKTCDCGIYEILHCNIIQEWPFHCDDPSKPFTVYNLHDHDKNPLFCPANSALYPGVIGQNSNCIHDDQHSGYQLKFSYELQPCLDRGSLTHFSKINAKTITITNTLEFSVQTHAAAIMKLLVKETKPLYYERRNKLVTEQMMIYGKICIH